MGRAGFPYGLRTGAYMDGNAINAAGVVAGFSASPDGTAHAVISRGSAITDLGGMSGYSLTSAKAINAVGQVVGKADPQCSPCVTPRAWVWEPGGTITPLDSLIPAGSGWSLQDATGINDLGQIVGTGLHHGVQRAFVLTRPPGSTSTSSRPGRPLRPGTRLIPAPPTATAAAA